MKVRMQKKNKFPKFRYLDKVRVKIPNPPNQFSEENIFFDGAEGVVREVQSPVMFCDKQWHYRVFFEMEVRWFAENELELIK